MSLFKNPKSLYANRAKTYEWIMQFARYNGGLKNIVQTLNLSELSKQPIFLDLGCGTGLVTECLMHRFSESTAVGFDFSKEMLERYKVRFPNAHIVNGDYFDEKTWALPYEQYDLIISSGSISEYSDLSKTLPWIFKILKPRGLFINIGVHRNFFGLTSKHLWEYREVYGAKRISELCAHQGFHRVEWHPLSWKFFPLNLFRYVLKAQK